MCESHEEGRPRKNFGGGSKAPTRSTLQNRAAVNILRKGLMASVKRKRAEIQREAAGIYFEETWGHSD